MHVLEQLTEADVDEIEAVIKGLTRQEYQVNPTHVILGDTVNLVAGQMRLPDIRVTRAGRIIGCILEDEKFIDWIYEDGLVLPPLVYKV